MNYRKYNQYNAVLENLPFDQGLTTKFCKDPASLPKGYIRLETGNNKGALYCNAENLKYQEQSGYLYKLIFLGKKEGRVIFINAGTLAVSRNGRGETAYHFNPSLMDSGKNSLHDFSSVVIAGISTKNIDEDMYPLLMCRLPAPPDDEQEPEALDILAFFKGEPVSGEKKEPQKEPPKEQPAEKEVPPSRSRSAQAAKKASKQKVSDPPPAPQTYNHYYNDFIRARCSQMYQSINSYEEVWPFGSGIQDIRWYKILDIMCLPFINASCQFATADYFRSGKSKTGMVHLSCQDLSARYRHFILGIKLAKPASEQEESIEKYYFGIPGTYCKEEQPDCGKSGFRYWQPLSGGSHDKNTYGYWIVAVDAKTGDIEEISPPESV